MATANPIDSLPSADESIFDTMREQIIATFDKLIEKVKSRRDQLLSEVVKKRREFELKNSATIESMRELEEMRSQLRKMSVRQNLALKKRQDYVADIDSELDKLKTEMHRNTQLKYSCSLDQLIQQVEQFGQIIDEANALTNSNYCKKQTAVQVIEGFEGGGFNSSMRLHVDSYKDILYVTYLGRKTVMLYNAENFRFVQEFGNTKYPPRCVTAGKEFIYVVSTNNSLLQYRSSDFSFVGIIESSYFQLVYSYTSISVSEDSQVFVLNCCGTIEVYDRDLNLKQIIELDLERFRFPDYGNCLSMVMKGDKLYILLTNKLLLFVSLGKYKNIDYCFKKEEGKIPNMKNPRSFCIDPVGNVIVADSATNSIKFLSPEGDLIHTIEEDIGWSDYTVRFSSIAV